MQAQTDQEIAYKKAIEAIKLMDEGKLAESIEILKESSKLDPENILYPYEIALAYTRYQDYLQSIKILKKVLKKSEGNSQYYQLLGNNYSYLNKKEKALEAYTEGLKAFPNSGNLHLESGNIYLIREDYDKAIEFYEKGIEVDPEFPSNYYRLALLFLHSSDKLSGLIYGEIFMNLERTSARTIEMSKLLFETYEKSVTFMGDSTRTEFCKIIIDARDLENGNLSLPFCAIFGKHFMLSLIGQEKISLKSLTEIRADFIESYYQKRGDTPADAITYPNALYYYHKKMKDAEVFDAYNFYLFQIARKEEFNQWQEENTKDYEAFVEWYTSADNHLAIDALNLFLRD